MASGDTSRAERDGQEFVPWPDWRVGNIPALAQYVSTPALDEVGLPSPDRFTDTDVTLEAGRSIARAIYSNILGLRLKYMHEPWRVEKFGFRDAEPLQRVRYPAWMLRDSGGTCLDLAILYATALMRAQIRPYLAILYPSALADSVSGRLTGHAFVIADLRAPLTAQRWTVAPSPMEPSAACADDGSLIIRSGKDLPPYLLAVDPTRATTNFPVASGVTSAQAEEFEATAAAAAGYLGETDIRLCDVATAQVRGFPALVRPADSATPAIWARLPELPKVTDYPSRAPRLEQLKEACGRIVVHGRPGLGKSTLAGIRKAPPGWCGSSPGITWPTVPMRSTSRT